MMMKIFFLIFLATLNIRADCSSPSAVAGQLQWITSSAKIMWCDGTNWKDASVATGASCTGTTSGTINYLSGDLRFCNGTNWVSMKGASAGAAGGLVSGTVKYNTSSSKLQFSDGSSLYDLGLVAAAGVTFMNSGYSTCSLASSTLKCVGLNQVGELGDGTTTNRTSPVVVSGVVATQVTGMYMSQFNWLGGGTSEVTACVLLGDALKCWGYNASGQLGDGSTTNRYVATQVSGLTSNVTGTLALTNGVGIMNPNCAILAGGQLKCWGSSVGDGTASVRNTPTQVTGLTSGVTLVAGGFSHRCVIVNEAAKCWGSNGNGQLGDSSTTLRAAPVQVTGLTSGVTQILPSLSQTYAIVSGSLKSWGYNGNGELGDSSTTQRTAPVQVTGLTSGVTQVFSNGSNGCAIVNNALKCWGLNNLNQIGDGTTTNRTAPTQVTGLTSGVTTVAMGSATACALLTNGSVRCWGNDFYTPINYGSTPTQMTGISSGATEIISVTSRALSEAYDSYCARVNGIVKCWGYNGNGQLGDGTTTNRSTPVTSQLP